MYTLLGPVSSLQVAMPHVWFGALAWLTRGARANLARTSLCCACAAPPASRPSHPPPLTAISFTPKPGASILLPCTQQQHYSYPPPRLRSPNRLLLLLLPHFSPQSIALLPRLEWLGFGEREVRRHDDAGSQARRDFRPLCTRCTLPSISPPLNRVSLRRCVLFVLGQLVSRKDGDLAGVEKFFGS